MIESKPVPDPSDNLLIFQLEVFKKALKDRDLGYFLTISNREECATAADKISVKVLQEVFASVLKNEYKLLDRLLFALRIIF